MGKIFCLMGKSSSGKDSVYRELMRQEEIPLRSVICYTTRPIREGEAEGREYFFCDEAKVQELSAAGRIIELRTYHTVYGDWKYFTADDGQIRLETDSYLVIGTLESYRKLMAYFGRDIVIPIYIEVEDGERLMRAICREKTQAVPKYAEMCRRFLADSEDFAEEKLTELGITKRFENTELADTVSAVSAYILEQLS